MSHHPCFFLVNFVMLPKWWSSIRRFSHMWLQVKLKNNIC
jgi:hypothetical protein